MLHGCRARRAVLEFPLAKEIHALCRLYGATDSVCQELVDKARAEDGADINLPSVDTYTDQLSNIMLLETQARTVTECELAFFPGVLQTADYARAVFATVGRSEAELERRVTTRLSRQSLLTRPNGPQLRFLVDEFALHRLIGGAAVMRRQLWNASSGSELPNVHLRVVPASIGAHAGLDGPFALYEFPALETHVYLENREGGIFLADTRVSRSYVAARDQMWRDALDEADSRALLREVAERLRDG